MNVAELDSLPLVQAALWYADRGIPLFPCRPRGKEPLVEGGFHAATTEEARIREWWERWPQANIGIPTGAASGWLVLDIDPRHGGDKTLDNLLNKYGRWPDTAEAITGGGGRHVFFQHVAGLRCGPIGPGVDLKTEGGYVVVAPSVHPSGNRYFWDGLSGAGALDHLVEPPGWLLRLARERSAQRSSTAEGAAEEPIHEGERNTTLFRLAASLRARGLSQAAIEAALQAENQVRCQPPLPNDEVERIAASAAKYPPGERGAWGAKASAVNAAVDALNAACPPRERPVDTKAPRTPEEALAVLNSLMLWGGRVRWAAFKRVGGQLVGVTIDGEEARYEVPKLVEFRHIQSRTLEYLGVALAPPKRGMYAVVAGMVGELMLRAAEDTVDAGSLEDDVQALLARCWQSAGCPTITETSELYIIALKLREYRRQPYAEEAPPCVVRYGIDVLVHPAIFQLWVGCPSGAARHLTLVEIRQALGLLGMRPYEFDLERDGQRQCITLWRGPVEVLHG
jgi:hypothetical protein